VYKRQALGCFFEFFVPQLEGCGVGRELFSFFLNYRLLEGMGYMLDISCRLKLLFHILLIIKNMVDLSDNYDGESQAMLSSLQPGKSLDEKLLKTAKNISDGVYSHDSFTKHFIIEKDIMTLY
jgi:hypothetical protein